MSGHFGKPPIRNHRLPPPPGSRTLGEAKNAAAAAGKLNPGMLANKSGSDPEGNPTQLDRNQMRQLLRQGQELRAAGVTPAGGDQTQLPPPMRGPAPAGDQSHLPPNVRDQQAPDFEEPFADNPNVTQTTVMRERPPQRSSREEFLPSDFDKMGDGTLREPIKNPGRPPIPEGKTLLTNEAANRDRSGLRPPPPITPSQARAQREARRATTVRAPDEDKPDEQAGAVYTGKPRFILKKAYGGNAKFERLPILSGCVFYPFKEVEIRKFSIDDHLKVMKAQNTKDITMLIDAIGGTLSPDIDIRDFTVPDWMFTLFWHRLNSYTSTPYIVSWTSQYGNENKYKITDTSLSYVVPTITEEGYAEWQDKGFAVPTLRDWEVGRLQELSEEERVLFLRAQWFKGVPNEDGVVDIQQKIDGMERACDGGLGPLGMLDDFQKAINHAIKETIDVTDANFDPRKWLEVLRAQIEYLETDAETVQTVNPMHYVNLMNRAEDLRAEADTIEKTLEEGGEVMPDVETVTLNTDPLSFFPAI